MTTRHRAGLLAALLAVSTAGCGSAAATGNASGSEVEHVAMEVNDSMHFLPDEIVVHPGTVEVTIRNEGTIAHNLDFPSLHSVSATVFAGDTTTMKIHVPRPGTYPFVCDFHISEGMVGTLVATATPDPTTAP